MSFLGRHDEKKVIYIGKGNIKKGRRKYVDGSGQ